MPGDWVLAQDESDPEAIPTLRQVEEVFENQAQVMVLGLGGWTIETTPEHPFWVRDKGWTAAGEIEPGDELRSHDGQWIPLDSKLLTDNIVTVYNMRVAEDHTYFVGSPLWGFNVWAHNACVLGGTYSDVRKANIGGEVHHMPAASINGMPYNKGPAIWMEAIDHRKTASWGYSRAAINYRARQSEFIRNGKLREAIQMDIRDIARLFRTKYNEGIKQMLEQLEL